MTLEKIAPDLFRFVFAGIQSNAFVLTGSQVILIDSGMQSQALEFKKALEQEGFRTADIAGVLHTHGHADHFGTSYLFPLARQFMAEPDAKFVNARDRSFSFADQLGTTKFPVIGESLYPGSVLFLGGFEFEILGTPGHTRGSVCLLEKSRHWLFSGDTLFGGTCGRVDLPSGNALEMKDSLQTLKTRKFDLLLPGHGSSVAAHQKANIDRALRVLGI